jgi:hypothetical protein
VESRERDVEDPQRRAEGGDLGGGGHEARDRRWCTLIHVGDPGVERHGADLEQQANRQQRDADQRHGLVAASCGDRVADTR